MNTVKTYKDVNTNKKDLHFAISKMEDIYDKNAGKVDEPHRHNYYTVLVVNSAKGLHKIDFNAYKLGQHQIYFIAPGQVHQMIEDEKSVGFAMTFSTPFLVKNNIPLAFIDSLNLFQNYDQSPPLLPNLDQYNRINNFCNEIFNLYHSQANMKNLSIGSFLKLVLIECNNLCSTDPLIGSKDTASHTIIKTFKSLVDTHYKSEHRTGFYANELNITPDHLNRVIKTHIGKTSKEYIQSRVVTEAKRLLFFTDLTNKEISYELGFNEPANFSAFFKKYTKLSPSSFKNKENAI